MSTWSAATLRIFSDELEADKIASMLNHNPTKTIRKNDPVSFHNPESHRYSHHVWIMESGINSAEPLENHINIILDFLEQKKDIIAVLVQNCELNIFCGISFENRNGVHLSTGIIKRLSEYPVDLLFDVYD